MNLNRRSFLLASTGLVVASNTLAQSSMLPKNQTPLASGTAKSLDLSRLLRCIAEVETGNDDTKVGPKGERSRYQISKGVWIQHRLTWSCRTVDTIRPMTFEQDCHGQFAKHCAHNHTHWLHAYLPPCTRPFWLAFAWRAGLERTKLELRGASVTPAFYNYARRVTNLYEDVTFSS